MENKIAIGLKLKRSLIEELDEVRASFPAPATRTACIETAIREWISRNKKREREK